MCIRDSYKTDTTTTGSSTASSTNTESGTGVVPVSYTHLAAAEAPATAVKKKKRLFKYHKRMNRSLGGDIAFFAFLFIASLFFAFPMVFAISNSLKKMNELFLFPPTLIVKEPTLKNYTDLFNIMANSLVPMSK